MYPRSRLAVFLSEVREQLYAARKKAKSLTSFTPWWSGYNNTANITGIHAFSGSYFETVERLNPNIHTLKFVYPFHRTSDILLRQYYSVTSNDCQLMKGTQNFHQYHCMPDIEDSFSRDATPVRAAFSIGLPHGYLDQLSSNSSVVLTYIHVLTDAFAFIDGDVINNGVLIVPQRCGRIEDLSRRPHPRVLRSSPIYEEVFVIGQRRGYGFYHSTFENLARLAPYVSFLKENPHIKIHAVMVPPLLPLLGINSSRVITGAIRARTLYMPAGVPCGVPLLFTSQLLSRRLRKPVDKLARNFVILIDRFAKRWFAHHHGIRARLEQLTASRGLNVQVFSDNPLPTQEEIRSMFGRAVLVVAPHGAGETNLVFSKPGTVLLEGLCYMAPNLTSKCYHTMSYVLGLRYHGLIFNKDCFYITPDDIEGPVRSILDLLQSPVQSRNFHLHLNPSNRTNMNSTERFE